MDVKSTSIYTRSLTPEEYSQLQKQFPMGTVPVVDPRLAAFANIVARNPYIGLAELQAYGVHLKQCECWYCTVIKQRPEITLYDLWLRDLLCCNGLLHQQLN